MLVVIRSDVSFIFVVALVAFLAEVACGPGQFDLHDQVGDWHRLLTEEVLSGFTSALSLWVK